MQLRAFLLVRSLATDKLNGAEGGPSVRRDIEVVTAAGSLINWSKGQEAGAQPSNCLVLKTFNLSPIVSILCLEACNSLTGKGLRRTLSALRRILCIQSIHNKDFAWRGRG